MRTKPMIENVPDPINRWTIIPTNDFIVSLKQAIKENNEAQIKHLLDDFWFCDDYMLLKSDIQGGMQ